MRGRVSPSRFVMGLGSTSRVLVTAVLLSSGCFLQTSGADNTTVLSQPSVEASSGKFFPGVTGRIALKGSNFDKNITALYFDPPASDHIIRVVSSTRAVLFVKIGSRPPSETSYGLPPAVRSSNEFKIVAIDSAAGTVQLSPEHGGVVIGVVENGTCWANPFKPQRESQLENDDTTVPSPPSVRASWKEIKPGTRVQVAGANFDLQYTELYFDPPLREEGILSYQISRSNQIRIEFHTENLEHGPFEPGLLKVVAIDTSAGLVPLNPGDGGVVVGMVSPYQDRYDITVEDNESLHIYQSTEQFQITGSGFEDNTMLAFTNGLLGGGTRSILHTKLGEQPDQLTLELADGHTWMQNPGNLPKPLELRSAIAGNKGWSFIGPADAPPATRTVALVFEDPRIDASDTDIFHGYTETLVIRGTGFVRQHRTILEFDPPIDPEIVDVFVRAINLVTVSIKPGAVQWAPAGYFGPLKIKGVDTGAGMVVLDPLVTVAKVVPGSLYDFFLANRIHELREDGAVRIHQDRVDQAAREWQAMTPAEQTQAAGAVVPTPSVEASSVEIYMRGTWFLVVNGANFSPEAKLIFEPPPDEAFGQEFVSSTKLNIFANVDTYFGDEAWRAEPGPLKVVAVDTGAGLVRLNPDDGGVVVAIVKADITVQENESLRIYQSTNQIRIAGSGFEDVTKVHFYEGLHEQEPTYAISDTKPDQLTLSLVEGSAWIKNPSSLPVALLVGKIEASPGDVRFFDNVLSGQKVATVFENPSIQASNIKIRPGSTHELTIYGTGFNKVVPPVLDFDPPLASPVNFHVVNRTMIRLTLPATAADWTRAEPYLGPLRIKGVDTGAGTVVFDSPVMVTTVVPNVGAHDEEMAQFISSTRIAITKDYDHERSPSSMAWRAEPGPLKVVAIDIGAGLVKLNPEDGGVVVATVRPDVDVQNNESLYIYQSTNQVQVAGSGFDGDSTLISRFFVIALAVEKVNLMFLGSRKRGDRTRHYNVTTVANNQLVLNLVGEGSAWIEVGLRVNARPSVGRRGYMELDVCFVSRKRAERILRNVLNFPILSSTWSAVNLMVNNHPSLPFCVMAVKLLAFFSHTNLAKVVNRTMIRVTLDNAQSGWVPAEHLGPLKVKGLDTGAGMVMFDSPVTVAIVVPDSEFPLNQGIEVLINILAPNSPEGVTPSLHEAGKAAELEGEEHNEQESSLQVGNSAVLPPPSVEACSKVIDMKATDSLVVNGDNFDLSTRLIFDPPLGRGFEMRVFSRTEIDVFTKFVLGGAPGPWRAEPGPLKVVAINTGAGLVHLNPDDGGVVVAMVE
ncbi:unnamed protein product [Pylaiella littoralis]